MTFYDSASALQSFEDAYTTIIQRTTSSSEAFKTKGKSIALDGGFHPRVLTLGGASCYQPFPQTNSAPLFITPLQVDEADPATPTSLRRSHARPSHHAVALLGLRSAYGEFLRSSLTLLPLLPSTPHLAL